MNLSVVIPVYNVENYLQQCLDSVVELECTGMYEVLLVDDCGQDESMRIAQMYCEKYPDIFKIIVHNSNSGLSASRNTGIEHSCGDFIMFVDSDDWLVKSALSDILSALKDNVADMLFFDHVRVWPNKRIECKSSFAENEVFSAKTEISSLITQTPVNAWSKVYRSNLFNKWKFPDGVIFEDLAVVPAIMNSCATIIYLNKILYCYRQRPNSLTSTNINDPKKLFAAHEVLKLNYNISPDPAIIYLSVRDLLIYLPRALISHDLTNAHDYLNSGVKWLDENYPNWKKCEYFSFSKGRKNGFFKLIFPLLRFKLGCYLFLIFTNPDRAIEKRFGRKK